MRRLGGRGLWSVLILFVAAVALAVPAVAAAPTVSSFTPTSGPLRTSVKITGSNFVAPVTVKFNGTAATSVVVNSSTQVTAQVPGSANSGPISVTSGGATVTSAASFTVTPGVYLPVTAGPPGSKVAVYFSGFTAYEAVDVYFDSTDLKLVSASGTGSGVATPIVPAKATPGEHSFSAVGRKSGSSVQGTFTVRTDWPQYSNNAARTGENSTESILGPGNVKKLGKAWTTKAPTNGYYSNQLIVSGGIAFAFVYSGVTALSVNTGSVLWVRGIPSGVSTTPVVSGSTLVLGTSEGHLIGLNTSTGAIRFDQNVDLRFYAPLVIVGGKGYAVTTDPADLTTSVIAFDLSTGLTKWGHNIASSCSAPAASSFAIYTTCGDGRMYGLRLSDGAQLFADADYRYGSTIAVVGDRLAVGAVDTATGAKLLIVMDAETGVAVWSRTTSIFLASPTMSITTADQIVVIRGKSDSNAYVVAAFSVADGTPLWSVPGTDPNTTSMTIANGLLYVPDATVTNVLDLDTGTGVTKLPGGHFAVVVDASVINTDGTGKSVTEMSLPASALPAARQTAVSALRPNYALKVAS